MGSSSARALPRHTSTRSIQRLFHVLHLRPRRLSQRRPPPRHRRQSLRADAWRWSRVLRNRVPHRLRRDAHDPAYVHRPGRLLPGRRARGGTRTRVFRRDRPRRSERHGTLFKVHANGTFTSLHDFDGSDGHEPGSGLALAGDGNFYGTTVEGGDYGLGTAYRIDALGNFASIHSFAGAPDEGQNPWGRLLPGSDGNLYGTTYLAGPADHGTIFRMDTDGNQTTIHSCPVNFFGTSTAALIEVAVGEFYGVAPLFHPYGEVFRVDAGGTVTPVHVFAGGREGSFPSAPLVKTADGALYGTAATVYRLLPQPDPPSLSRLEPSSGRVGGGGSVAVRGHHFREGVAANFGGVDVAGIYFDRESKLIAIAPPLPAGTLQDVTVTNPDASTATLPGAWFADFLDVPGADGFHDSVEAIFRAGITAGCGGGLYCRNDAVSRAQMAVFILKAKHGAGYTPPSCSGYLRRRVVSLAVRGLDRAARGGGHHRRLRRQQLLSHGPRSARSNGGIPPQGRARFRLRASGLPGRLRRRHLSLPLLRLDRAARSRADHRRLRQRQLLPSWPEHSWPDGGVPREDFPSRPDVRTVIVRDPSCEARLASKMSS